MPDDPRSDRIAPAPRTRRRISWPWTILALIALPAAWHLLVFPVGVDGEFPRVARPTFSAFPPASYRLAEPGDTLDRVGMYLASGAIVLAAYGLIRSMAIGLGARGWPTALGLATAGYWTAANPWPTFDGWHGLGWHAIVDPGAPIGLRIGLACAATVLGLLIVVPLLRIEVPPGGWVRFSIPRWVRFSEPRGVGPILIGAAVLLAGRWVGPPAIGPPGYLPRWAFIGGACLFVAALIRCLPPAPARRPGRLGAVVGLVGVVAMLIHIGLWLTWYHRPIERLRAIAPGKIYISAMPEAEALEIAQRRHGFRTIINLFQEDLPGLRSPLLDEEIAFAEDHGIRYLGSPIGPEAAEGFLNETLRLARDPDAWPILIHCHACMDRTPAWWGIYQFLVEGKPLIDAMRSIEQHRGTRPKASVTLLYNRVLSERAPERYRDDPTAAVLRRSAEGTDDPFPEPMGAERLVLESDDSPERPGRR